MSFFFISPTVQNTNIARSHAEHHTAAQSVCIKWQKILKNAQGDVCQCHLVSAKPKDIQFNMIRTAETAFTVIFA